ncbi:MAG: UDP-glucose/GDP-mannose dehydrogenase family protein [Candidatus Roizmanbacteria bacterium]|nr:MAG: UDP-glucose/GDP-mannose dehydrogenase family protein [Candidatus Roizmanbacteria bacterium]
MTITVVGHGYVGLVTACVFSDFGNKVWVVGHTPEKIDRLKKGDPIIYEPGLKEFLGKNLAAQRLHFTLDYKQAVSESDIVFITVGTPPTHNGEADLSAVFDVATNIGKNLKKGFTVVSCKSTVLVGTNKKVEEILNKNKRKDAQVAVASCPEFLREGTALHDTINPDRIVIGSDSNKAIDRLLELHEPLTGDRVITDLASAELIKYTSNAMLATKISFANLIAFYCEKTGADVETVLNAVGLDKRIGRVFLYPGVGYGGSCLPKDVNALVHTGRNFGIDVKFLDAVEKINADSRNNYLDKVLKHCKGKHIAIWGLGFKPDTDDIRAAPSVFLIKALLEQGFKLTVYDPEATKNIRKMFGDKITYAQNAYDAVKDACTLCILTEWNEFKQADLKKVKSLMKNPVIIDGRNIYQLEFIKKLGFTYISTGRQPIL